VATDTQITTDEEFVCVFCLWSAPGHKRTHNLFAVSQSRVEAGSNTSTVALRVVGGDEKGSLESETANMVASPTGLGPENDCAGEGKQQL
jgi:hypothetical protein